MTLHEFYEKLYNFRKDKDIPPKLSRSILSKIIKGDKDEDEDSCVGLYRSNIYLK